jgi:hypothetical protein
MAFALTLDKLNSPSGTLWNPIKVHQMHSSGRPAEVSSPRCREEEWRESGTVLLVDDEETVREIGSEMLKEEEGLLPGIVKRQSFNMKEVLGVSGG